ncbi:hypothetical protein Tco_0835036 [Tanacetum coccineum]
MKQQLRSGNRRLGIKGQQPLTTPFPAALSVPLRISSIKLPGSGNLNLPYVLLMFTGLVLKLADDPSPGDSESKSNLTRNSRNFLAEGQQHGFMRAGVLLAFKQNCWLCDARQESRRGGDEEEVKTKKGCTCGRKIEKGAINAYRGIVKRVNTELGRLALKPDLQSSKKEIATDIDSTKKKIA